VSEQYEYGVAYMIGLDGSPVQLLVEAADDEQDAIQWRYASGDPDARIVRRRVGDETWEVVP
jgi:hypothetical protein